MGFFGFVSSLHLQDSRSKRISSLIDWIYPPDLWRIKIMSILLSGLVFSWGELLPLIHVSSTCASCFASDRTRYGGQMAVQRALEERLDDDVVDPGHRSRSPFGKPDI
jgi:hypothetical protein